MEQDKMSLENLINETAMKKTQFAREANVSYGHLLRVLRGETISRAYAQRIVNVLNKELGRKLTIDDLNFHLGE